MAELSGPILQRALTLTVVYTLDSGKSASSRVKFWNECFTLIPADTDLLLGDFNVTLRPEDSSSPQKHREWPMPSLPAWISWPWLT